MKKILIADDHSLFGSGLSSLFTGAGYKVLGNIEHGDDVLYAVISLNPDILILDLNLPKKNGLEVLREVRDYTKRMVVIVVTMYDDRTMINTVRENGGNGYFLKNSDQDELLNAVANLTTDDFYLSKTVSIDGENDGFEIVDDEFSSVVKLTTREKEILKLLVEGMSSTEIGMELNISTETVKTHRKNMLKKLSFNKVSELVSYAFRNNLV